MIQARADSRLLLWYGVEGGNSTQATSCHSESQNKSYFDRNQRMNYNRPLKIKSALVKKFPVDKNVGKSTPDEPQNTPSVEPPSIVASPVEPKVEPSLPNATPTMITTSQQTIITKTSATSIAPPLSVLPTPTAPSTPSIVTPTSPSIITPELPSSPTKTAHKTPSSPPAVACVVPSAYSIESNSAEAINDDAKWDAQPIAPPEFRGDVEPLERERKLESNNSLIGVIQSTLDSDQESEADLYKGLSVKEVSLDSEPEGSILSAEEDDDFKVHFVHHGKKVPEDKMNHRPDLMQQINELQEAVVAMKGSLREAVANLSSVAEDSSSGKEVEDLKRKCEGNSAEILKMVLGVRTDLSILRNEVTSICNRQDSLQKTVNLLLGDRRSIGTDLTDAGVSHPSRNRLDCFNGVVELTGGGGQSGSGSHSNDSGVALLTEKTHNSFTDDSGTLQSSIGHRTSDQDSLPDQPSLLVPSSVYDYVAGLHQPHLSLSSNNSSQYMCQGALPPNDNESNYHIKEESEGRILDSDDAGILYDSDSSLTIAANKTLSLSTCLSQEMRVKDAYASKGCQTQSSSTEVKQRMSKGNRDASNQSKEVNSQNRRRRPLLGVSSTKQYHSSSQIHSTDKERHRHKHRHVSKSDPRESQRYKIAKELLDTEKKYCRTLWTIQETFAEPLKKAAILSNKDIATLFPEEVYQLYDKHCLLQHQLKERLASWKWQPQIGDILSRFTDPRHCEILRLYTNYVNDFPEVLKTFHKLCHTSQPFTEFIKSCLEQPSCGGQDLGAFLLTPVQRVPRYILVLKQLLKHTDSSHPDYKLINTCLERLRDFLSRLNDAIEHSFRLVHSSLSTAITSTAGVTAPVSSKYRCGRSPGRSGQSRESPSCSPSDRKNRRARIYEASSSTEMYRSPQRSCSNAGPSSTKLSVHPSASRSASLPRGFLSSSESSGEGGQESSPERSRSRGLQKALSTHEPTAYRAAPKFHQLTTARSVTDIAIEDEKRMASRWEDLASSEPSLIDTKLMKKASTLESAQSAHNVATTHKLVTWTDSVESEEAKSKKRTSIKSSIKSMFTFKKRGTTGRNCRDEPLYWPSSVIMESAEPTSATSLNQHSEQDNPTIGDFVDEDGNPCTNV